MSTSSFDVSELVPPPFDRRGRIAAIGVVVLVLLIPVLAWVGLARPYVTARSGGGQWDQVTGLGSMTISVENRGLFATSVTAIAVDGLGVTLHRPAVIGARTSSDVLVDFRMSCAQTHTHPASASITVAGPWPATLSYDVTELFDELLPNPEACAG
jgi:hypothetical protein